MATTTFQPSVNAIQEFIEIANDFANPLDLVREAISNAFDAKATAMWISFEVIKEVGESVLLITLEDNGDGLNEETIRSFFDLGNSTRRQDRETIGEKGHGTKVYFNSSSVQVKTRTHGQRITATMDEPYKKLFGYELPTVTISTEARRSASIRTWSRHGRNKRWSNCPECSRTGAPSSRSMRRRTSCFQRMFKGAELPPPHSHPASQPAPGPEGRVPSDWESRLN